MLGLDCVNRRFGERTGVENRGLAIAPGEFFSLLGLSGWGKTATLRVIAGFGRPARGRVLLQRSHLTETPPHRRPVNLMVENDALFPHLTV
jgi:ABC-type Fe3+/spermidine/putrescine transport system ATPase subunit